MRFKPTNTKLTWDLHYLILLSDPWTTKPFIVTSHPSPKKGGGGSFGFPIIFQMVAHKRSSFGM